MNFRLALLLIIWVLQYAQNLQAREFNIPVHYLSVADGLPQNSVYSLYQDRKGFIWIGTGDGLARWDGKTFRTYRGRYNDTSGKSLTARIIRGRMLEDSYGRLWFTSSQGLYAYDQKLQLFQLIPLPGNSNAELLKLAGMTSRGDIICADDLRCWIINAATRNVRGLPLGMVPASRIIQSTLQSDTLYTVTDIGLYAKPVYSGRSTFFSQRNILAIMPGDPGTLHLWLSDRIYILRNYRVEKEIPTDAEVRSRFNPILYAGNGLYYGATNLHGLSLFDLSTGTSITFQEGNKAGSDISSKLISALMLDHSQNLWIGTEGSGLNIADTKGFKFHTFLPKGSDNKPTELMAKSLLDVGGKLWIGTFGYGLYELDRSNSYARQWTTEGPETRRISLLHRDSSGRIWMNHEERIGIANTNTKGFIRSAIIPDGARGNIAALTLCETRRNSFLLGTTFSLHRMRVTIGGAITVNRLAPGSRVTTGLIASIKQYPDGSCFIGKVRDGFYRIRLAPGTDSITIVDEGLHQTGIRDFQFTNGNTIVWMATENGLVAYEPDHRQYYTLDEQDGLSNSHIYGIVPEADTALWVSTNKGLNYIRYRYTPEKGLQVSGVTPYTEKDGLQSNEFNTGAFCRMADGAIAFGGVAGVNWFYPKKIFTNPYAPTVAVTGVRVNEKPLASDTDYTFLHCISLPYNKNTLAFSFAALEYTNSSTNHFKYRLEGFDKDWAQTSSGEARYANLPPGEYTLKVMAANNDGIWNPEPSLLKVVIVPPWWQTAWAKLSGILIILAAAFALVRTYVRKRVRRQLHEIEKREAINEERIRISRDMHDELGTGLTKIALLTEVARRKAVPSQPTPLTEIASTSRMLTQKISEIVWTLNPQNDTLDTLASYIREYLQEQYDSLEDIHIITDYAEQFPPVILSHTVRQALLLVTKEAVNNAVKYSGAEDIMVTIDLEPDEIIFRVSDNGRGFVPGRKSLDQRAGGGNGLGNMAARMKSAGGRFSLDTAPGAGTTIVYSIPRH